MLTPLLPRAGKDPFLSVLGERVRGLRARRGLTRKALAQAASISERHLANLETGHGNASVMLLRQLAHALQCSIAELVGEDALGVAGVVADPPALARPRRRRRWRARAAR